MKEKNIIYRQTQIVYKTTGTGSPVVLIHGFAEDSTIWDNQVDFLKDKYRLIIPDLPGSGKSELIKNKEAGIEDYAAIIKQILDKEKIEKCIMIGHSMGGYITLSFAEKYATSLIAFELFHSSAYADDELKIETRNKAIDFINKNGTEPFLKTSIPGLFYDTGNSGIINALLEKGKTFLPESLVQYYQAMIGRPDRTAVLMNTSLPVLFIMGEHDKAVPIKHSLEQCHMPKKAHIYILRNSAHMGMLEETKKTNEILAKFLLNP